MVLKREKTPSHLHAERAPESAEDANRRAAAERALGLEGVHMIEDRRRRPGTRADRLERPAAE